MALWVDVPAAKPDDLSFIRRTPHSSRTNSFTASSDRHMPTVACMHASPHKSLKNEKNVIKLKTTYL